MTAPRHMARPAFVVLCGDDTVAHGTATFDTPVEARHWADRLPCPGHHKVVREGVYVEVA